MTSTKKTSPKKSKKQPITKEIGINVLVEKHPEVIPLLMAYGLHCVGCSFSEFDTLENGARIHGMDDEVLQMMIDDINRVIEEGID